MALRATGLPSRPGQSTRSGQGESRTHARPHDDRTETGATTPGLNGLVTQSSREIPRQSARFFAHRAACPDVGSETPARTAPEGWQRAPRLPALQHGPAFAL